jgi:hypothetical protein
VPAALVISDFPIVRATAQIILAPRYNVEAISWQGFTRGPRSAVDLILLDITTVTEATALSCAPLSGQSIMVLCSLHENDVRVYRAGAGGPRLHARLPTLLAALS